MPPSSSIRPGSFLPVASLTLTLLCLAPEPLHADALSTSLAGEWRFALDPNDVGTNEQWFARDLPGKIQLPGVLEAQGYGDEIGISTPWMLTLYDHFWYLRADYAAYTNAGSVKVPFLCQPPRHYLGAAWYQRDLELSTDLKGRRILLFLERPHWKTTVWLDNKEIGSDISLCAPHEYDFGLVPPGRHRISIRVDNRMQFPSPAGMHAMDAHSVSDSLDSAWNGIVGEIGIRWTTPVWIEDLQVYPHAATKSVTIKGTIGNITGQPGSGEFQMIVTPFIFSQPPKSVGGKMMNVVWSTNGGYFETELALDKDAGLWDEFNPTIYRLMVGFGTNSGNGRHFGLRDFKAVGQDFEINGRKTYLRGTHFGGDFPRTGYPPTDVESWKKIIQTCQDWGLNHMRFHSWCPPEAAFEAADQLGFYLQVECGLWNDFSPGSEMEKWLYAETDRILRVYGNHPSFVLLSASNEAHGNWKPSLTQWVEHFRAADPRRLYTPDTGWSLIDEPSPVTGADYLAIGRVGPNRVRGESGWFGRDYGSSLTGVNVPVIGHEVGQWVAYPDFEVIKKFTGFMQPGNYEIFRDSAAAHGLFGRAGSPLPAARPNADDGAHGVTRPTSKDFAQASGRFQLECYKEEIEANLRTPGLAGFQLLDLHDYTGQGTAFVGLLDPFWESKGYATPDEFRKFCNIVVPLARLTKRVFTTTDKFEVPVEMANFGAATQDDAWADWRIENAAGKTVAQGNFTVTNIPIGRSFPLGNVATDLSKLVAPAAYKLVVSTAGSQVDSEFFENDWNFWLYPASVPDSASTNVFITSSWDEAQRRLSAGGRVLFLPHNADLDWWSPPLARVPVFWNALMGPTWSRMLGLWGDTNHPALAEFPTGANCDWQWAEILRNTRAVNLDRLPRELQPIVQAIDDWNRNYKLGLVFECRVGPGRLMVCSADLDSSLDSRPVARQLRQSLLDYMAGGKFDPPVAVPAADIASLLFDTRIMQQLGATAEADGQSANAIIDGDPNTYWLSGDARGNGSKYPHELTVHFPAPVTMSGLVLMPRQNHREHQGDICDYAVQVSDDGNGWREIQQGRLASSFDPQSIHFPQTVTAKNLKLTALSGFGGDTAAALAELAVIYTGPKVANPDATNIEYQGVRTASPDIDAGTDVPNKTSRPAVSAAVNTAVPTGTAALTVDASSPPVIDQQVIKLGTTVRPDGAELTVDGTSLLRDGKRSMPVMGEFHFSRYDPREWRDELLKMKAGGIDVITTYVFWIHHEEIEGEWDWSGQRSLRDFALLCQQLGLQLIVRCGPWAHGECRNGGFPDWLLSKKGYRLRSDDPAYLDQVRTLYQQIAGQLQGLLWKDGGPVIGIQLDNEYRGPAQHLLTLKRIAREAGLDVPLYTRTGWPRLTSEMPYGEILPLYGSYADGFWDRKLTAMPGNFWEAFVFSPERLDTAAGGDRFTRPTANSSKPYPFLTCEIGGGMESSYHRRIRVAPEDVSAVPLVKLGSGGEMLGYYMYHGGSHPDGRLSSMQEAQKTKITNYNDMPEKSYDFLAPLGEFGQIRPQYNLLRRIHLFMHDFGAQLAAMPAFFPPGGPTNRNDSTSLRWSVRSDGHSGYLFVNNYQRLLPMPVRPNVQFNVRLSAGNLAIPARPTTIPANSSFFWPFNLNLGGARLIYATAQPMCQVDDGGTRYTIFTQTPGVPTEFVFDSQGIRIESSRGTVTETDGRIAINKVRPGTGAAVQLVTADGRHQSIVLLDEAAALGCLKAKVGGVDRVLLSPAGILLDGDVIRLHASNPADFSISMLPAPQTLCAGTKKIIGTQDGVFRRFKVRVTRPPAVKVAYEQVQSAGPARQISMGSQGVAEAPGAADFDQAAVWRVKLSAKTNLTCQVLLRVRYIGDVARLYLGETLLTDNFYDGGPFDLGINRFGLEVYQRGLIFKVLPLRKDAPVYLEPGAQPDFGTKDSIAKLKGINVIQEQELKLELQ